MTDIHNKFVENAIEVVKAEPNTIGLAIGGSWITKEIDEFSDLDFIIFTIDKIAPDRSGMTKFAEKFGNMLSSFTGEHVGEERLLICLFDNPLLHVDFKFLTPDEFYDRIENPTILWEKDHALTDIISNTEFNFPLPDYQWMEDRFWVWIHYTATKIGRGEYFEVFDNLNFLRSTVIIPLLQIKNGNLPRGFRKVEKNIAEEDQRKLEKTVPRYDRVSLIESFFQIIRMYVDLREMLYPSTIKYQKTTEIRSLKYLKEIVNR